MAIRIRNWSHFQHYKDRRPPWIKLHREMLDDPDWHALPGDSAKVLISLWLIASDADCTDGTLPDMRKLAFRLRMPEKTVAQHLIKLSQWLEQDDSEVLSSCKQVAVPETEERQRRDRGRDRGRDRDRFSPFPFSTPDDLPYKSPDFLKAFVAFEVVRKAKEKKNPYTEEARRMIVEALAAQPEPIAIMMLQNSVKSGWTGVFEPKGQDREACLLQYQQQKPPSMPTKFRIQPIIDPETGEELEAVRTLEYPTFEAMEAAMKAMQVDRKDDSAGYWLFTEAGYAQQVEAARHKRMFGGGLLRKI